MKLKSFTLTCLNAALIILTAITFATAQQEPGLSTDPIEQLRLTPDQRQAIRRIMADSREERQSTNGRLHEANVALDQALDAEPTDESLVEQRINELATAQAAQLRMRIHTEMKIRRILHPEQIATLRRLRLQVRDVVNPQRRNNRRVPPNQGFRPRP
jgi:Spy/CpxP family protein refolding chaperone